MIKEERISWKYQRMKTTKSERRAKMDGWSDQRLLRGHLKRLDSGKLIPIELTVR